MIQHHYPLSYPGGAPVLVIYSLSIILLADQTLPEIGAAAGQLERVGLIGCLLIAIGVLWRSLVKKDEQLQVITKQVSEALAFNTDTQKELRGIVEASTRAKQDLTEAIHDLKDGLTRLPCQGPVESRTFRAT